ncbi:MAG: thioredoxin domain-containing protein [Candidatus Omnitrophota bacterium]
MPRWVYTLSISFSIILLMFAASETLRRQDTLEKKIAGLELKLESHESKITSDLTAVQMALRSLPSALGRMAGNNPPAPQAPNPEDVNKVYKIDVGSSPVLGNKNAKVTIVEFSDFQCPYSQRFHPVVAEVLKAYPNDVNYILKNYPLGFHPNAKPAAKASLAAGEQGKYWEMVEALFANGKELSEEKYKELAKQIGINVDQFSKDLKEKDAQWEKMIAADLKTVEEVDARGTPTFYLNGKKTRARDLAGWKAEIDAVLKEKK